MDKTLEEIEDEKLGRNELKLIRHNLCSIDLSDVKIKLTPEDEMTRAQAAEKFYKVYFRRIINELINEQSKFLGKQAANMTQLSSGRGTINGLSLIRDWFEDQISFVRSKTDERGKKPEPGETGIPDITG